ASGTRFRTDSLGPPWDIPQSIRIRAWSVTSRNWEQVKVVAPPRNWISTGASCHASRAAFIRGRGEVAGSPASAEVLAASDPGQAVPTPDRADRTPLSRGRRAPPPRRDRHRDVPETGRGGAQAVERHERSP